MKRQKTKLQAVVLAGGLGTRLSPLTDSKPKPLVKILDTTVLQNVLCMLKKTDADGITVSTFYKSEMIEEICKSENESIVCKKELTPLGTAGGVKNCYDGKSKNVLVVSGDGIFDFDLQKAVDFHIEKGNDVTIVTCRKEDPTEYGVVICDENGNVTEFSEKPSWSKVRSNLVNTGIYVLSKYALDSIPENMKYDFSNNLFPKLLAESSKIGAFECDGFWCDIGTFDEYYNCQRLAASGKINLCTDNGENTKMLSEKGIHTEKNVYVSKGTYIGKNVSITDKSVICRGTEIHDNCDLSGVILGSGCQIGKGTSITGTIVGDNVIIGENCVIPRGCVIGDGCKIGEGTVLQGARRIKPYSLVSKEDKMNMDFSDRRCTFVSDGLAVMERQHSATCISDFARAVSLAYKKSKMRNSCIAVMTGENIKSVKENFLSGLECENTAVLDLGIGNEAMCRYACSLLLADAGVFISADEKKIYFTLFSHVGEYIDNSDERKISKLFASLSENTEPDIPGEENGQTVNVPIAEMYVISLLASTEKTLAGADFSQLEVCLKDSKSLPSRCFMRVFETLSGRIIASFSDGRMSVELTPDGQGVKVRCGDIVLDTNHVIALVLTNLDVLGISNVKYTKNVPYVLKSLMKDIKNEEKQNADIVSNLFCDGTVALLMLLCVMTLRGETLAGLIRDMPKFEIFSDEYIADVNRGETMERLSKLYSNTKDTDGDGIHLSLSDGNVTVIPNRAKGFKIIAEAQSMEAAKELSVKIGKAIKN